MTESQDYTDENQEEFVWCFAVMTALTLGVIAAVSVARLILRAVS